MKNIKYTYEVDEDFLEEHKSFPRPKQAIISVLTFRKRELSAQDNYLIHIKEEHSILWLKEKHEAFEIEWISIKQKLNAQFNNRGKNIAMECLQFGGNTEFWDDFPNEEEILAYFKRCYKYVIHYIGYLSTDKNIICAVIVTEGRRRNLFVYYLPITEKWAVKRMGQQISENGNKLQLRDEFRKALYKEVTDSNRPLLCHTEFWTMRGGLTSYSELQEDFYQAISKHYGAERGVSISLLKHTTAAQIKRFNRYEGDDNDLTPPIKGIRI